MSVYIHLQANGADLPGRANQPEIGGIDLTDHTEVVNYFSESARLRANNGVAAALQTSPYTVVKAFDGISPLLAKALEENQLVNANLLFFARAAGGQWLQSHSITLLNGRLTGLRQEYQLPAGTGGGTVFERITIQPTTIRWRSFIQQTEHEWNVQPLA